MREIEFRGRGHDGTWHYGWLVPTDTGDGFAILFGPMCLEEYQEVDPDTVGQFTGRTDVMRKEAYEGDIIICYDDRAHQLVGVIKWSDKACCWYMDCSAMGCDYFPFDIRYAFEIIGNIYDNPELLEGRDARD